MEEEKNQKGAERKPLEEQLELQGHSPPQQVREVSPV